MQFCETQQLLERSGINFRKIKSFKAFKEQRCSDEKLSGILHKKVEKKDSKEKCFGFA
jgi:hypothetical protein